MSSGSYAGGRAYPNRREFAACACHAGTRRNNKRRLGFPKRRSYGLPLLRQWRYHLHAMLGTSYKLVSVSSTGSS